MPSGTVTDSESGPTTAADTSTWDTAESSGSSGSTTSNSDAESTITGTSPGTSESAASSTYQDPSFSQTDSEPTKTDDGYPVPSGPSSSTDDPPFPTDVYSLPPAYGEPIPWQTSTIALDGSSDLVYTFQPTTLQTTSRVNEDASTVTSMVTKVPSAYEEPEESQTSTPGLPPIYGRKGVKLGPRKYKRGRMAG